MCIVHVVYALSYIKVCTLYVMTKRVNNRIPIGAVRGVTCQRVAGRETERVTELEMSIREPDKQNLVGPPPFWCTASGEVVPVKVSML
jgi:hypothetical protein